MAHFTFEDENIPFHDGETVLEALIRRDKNVAFSCKKGTCLSCMRKGDGPIDDRARANLSPAEKADGYFLMCQTPAAEGIAIFKETDAPTINAEITSIRALSKSIYKVMVRPENSFDYKAGQFVHILGPKGLTRSYSIASLPSDSELEFHIRLRPEGQMSSWLCTEAKAGDALSMRGPYGHCYYADGPSDQPILLVGTSSGLAPLYGILKDALDKGHKGPIHLYHGSRFTEDIYYNDDLNALADRHENFHYTACVSREYAGDKTQMGHAGEIAKANHPNLNGWKIFLCGSPNMVQDLQQSCFIMGANLDDILTDPFELMDLRRRSRP